MKVFLLLGSFLTIHEKNILFAEPNKDFRLSSHIFLDYGTETD